MKSLPDLTDTSAEALFFDFDGTLVEIADSPDRVTLGESTRANLETLARAYGGALAIVTGRDISTIDRFLAPLHLPIAGVHGIQRRDASGRLHVGPSDETMLSAIAERLRAMVAREEGILIEPKPGTFALHYRARPDLADACILAMERAVDGLEGFQITRGKMVVEAKPDHGDKGTAVAAFMAEPPFSGRRPVFAGDDLTDEDAFAAVNARDGVSIKIGAGATCARHRFRGTVAFLAWLDVLARHCGQGEGA